MIEGTRLRFSQLLLYSLIILSTMSCDAKLAIKFVINNNGLGPYSFEYKTADGTYRAEDGGLVTGPEGDSLVIRGEYGYIDTNGQPYSLKYVADVNGYHPQTDTSTKFNNRRII